MAAFFFVLSVPAHRWRQGHENSLNIAARFQPKQRSSVVQEVEFNVAPPPEQLVLAVFVGPWRVVVLLDQRHVSPPEPLAHVTR